MKKRTFLLLEVLIAFVLVTLCLIPLVRQPLKLYKDEMKYLEKMECERLADWTYTEVKEILLKNGIPWKKIPEKGVESEPFALAPATIQIPGCNLKTVERSFQLKGRGRKEGPKGEDYRQLGVWVYLNGVKYTFRTPVQKINHAEE